MSETIPSKENGSERFPNEREILNQFEEIIAGEFQITKKLEDEKGLYKLEAQRTDEAGDLEQYNYIRAGEYPEGSSLETVIDIVFFSGDIPVGGRAIKKYQGGEWIDEA
jgi:hypothetical protein